MINLHATCRCLQDQKVPQEQQERLDLRVSLDLWDIQEDLVLLECQVHLVQLDHQAFHQNRDRQDRQVLMDFLGQQGKQVNNVCIFGVFKF